MPIIRLKQIERKMIGSAKFQSRADAVIDNNVERARKALLNDFDNHKVTQEINAGPDSQNITNTIKGSEGNLWGFIGFINNPIPSMREYLSSVVKYTKKEVRDKKIIYRVTVPTSVDLEAEHPYPDNWNTGSWIRGIQRGISGFRFFLAEARKGRSDGGIQVETDLRGGGSFKTVRYIGEIIQKFKMRIKRSKSVL